MMKSSSIWVLTLLIMALLHQPRNVAEAFQVGSKTRLGSPGTIKDKDHQPRDRMPTRIQYMDTEEDTEVLTMERPALPTNAEQPISLVPLSREPILLVSSEPLLTIDECNVLQSHLQSKHSEHGELLLQRVQSQIDELTGCPRHSGEAPVPRFLLYEKHSRDSTLETTSTRLFPDGLHVDTNNGQYFRHVTCLLYLTANDDGATTFPLANPPDPNDDDELRTAAQTLLDMGVTHTLDKSQSDENRKLSKMLEDAGRDLFLEGDREQASSTRGVRVLPRAGMLCVFSNLLETGMADPLSFHGGEAGSGDKEKALLVFFKEIPMECFSSQAELGQCATKTRKYLIERYY